MVLPESDVELVSLGIQAPFLLLATLSESLDISMSTTSISLEIIDGADIPS